MAYVWFALICVVWGSSFILMKKAVLCFSPVTVGLGRVLGGAAILALLWAWSSRRWSVSRRDLPLLALLIVLGFAWPYSIQPYLVAHHGSGFIGITVSFTPLLTILVSVPLLGTYPKPRQLLGVLGALICLGLLLRDGRERAMSATDLLLALTVPLGYAITNTLIRRSMRHVPALELTLIALSSTAILLTPPALMNPGPGGTNREISIAVGSLLILGVFGTGLAMFLFNRLIHGHGPLFAGMVTNLVPVGALLWGWADGERVTALQVGALAGLLLMVALVQYEGTQVRVGPPGTDESALAA